MSDRPFQFKQFSVAQENCAMKVGTDGVLLGAWARIPEGAGSVLDIGTGTGLIALQIAQRSHCDTIDALEVEDRAFEQAVDNFENSPWSDRLFCYHASLEEFRAEIDDRYDLIVCNPPYHDASYLSEGSERNLARQRQQMSFESLLNAVADLLDPAGTCAFIIPYEHEREFLVLARRNDLFPERITRVRGNSGSPLKRSLIQMGRVENSASVEELILEIDRHVYTPEYVSLVRDFYLKM